MTMCMSPWALIGASHENALSIRCGVPSAATNRSSGPVGNQSGGPGSGVFGFTSPGLPAGLSASGVWRGNGGL